MSNQTGDSQRNGPGIERYSAPGHKYPLVCSDQDRLARANSALQRDDLSEFGRAAVYFHEITGANGLELVAFTNLRLPNAAHVPGDLYLVPCFADLDEELASNDPRADTTQRMLTAARFVYDGWLPIRSWDTETINESIATVDRVLSSFAIAGPIWFDWQPKYKAVQHAAALMLGMRQLEQWATVVETIDALPPPDRDALYRSLAWLAQGIRLNEPSARLLFSVIAVESLATYIEEDSSDTSVLATVRSAKKSMAERRADRDACVRAIMETRLGIEPWKAVNQAYFDCAGTQNMLRAHLKDLFPTATDADVDRLLKGEADTVGLYKVRSQIAHGSAESVSRLEIERMRGLVHDAEQFARDYLQAVLSRSLGVGAFDPTILADSSASWLDAVYSAQGMYHGPTDLATLYGAAGGYSPGGSITLPRLG